MYPNFHDFKYEFLQFEFDLVHVFVVPYISYINSNYTLLTPNIQLFIVNQIKKSKFRLYIAGLRIIVSNFIDFITVIYSNIGLFKEERFILLQKKVLRRKLSS